MKVALLTSWFPTEANPVRGIFVQDQAVVLSGRFDVTVIAPSVGRGATRHPPSDAEQGVRVIRPRRVPRLPGRRSALSAWLAAAREGLVAMERERGAPDLIHAHVVFPAGWAAVELARETGAKVVLTEHASPFSPGSQAPRQEAKVRRALLEADQVVAVSPHQMAEITSFEPGCRVEVIGDLVRTDLFFPEERTVSDGPFVAAGGMTGQKDFGTLIEAVRILSRRGVRVPGVVIAGDGPLRGALERAAEGLPVRFPGTLDRTGLRALFAGSLGLVMPSLHESFGLVAAEAMACGTPAIVTSCGAPEWVVSPEAGIHVAPGSAAELADAMESFIDGRRSFEPGEARASVESRFGPEAFLSSVSRVYERVLDAG